MEKVWQKNYPEGAAFEINPDQYNSVVEVINETCEKYSDRTAFINMDVSLTFREVQEKSDAFANYLINDLNLKKGDVIMIQMPNLLQYPVALYGAFKAGLIVVNTNPLYTTREIKKVLDDSGAKAIVICSNFVSKLEEVVADSKIEHIITTQIGDFFPFVKRTLVNFVIKNIKKMVPTYKGSYTSLNEAIAKGAQSKATYPKLSNTDTALFQYTGGTTGKTKAAVLTHRNVIANMLQMAVWISDATDGETVKVLAPLPIYHVFTLSVNIFGFFYLGQANLLITNPRDLPSVVKDIKNHKPKVATIVNTLLQALVANEEFQKLDLSYMKLSVAGGMALKTSVKNKWEVLTHSKVIEGYGLTEASPVVTCNPPKNDIAGSIGIPIPSTNIKIIDEDENELGFNEEGELCVQGPQVMKEYWNQPEETAETFTKDGWLKTGDYATVDEEGFVRILDRKKDMIVVSGFNVYPNEVEEVLMECSGVQEVAAIGIDSDRSGQIVKVFIVKDKKDLDVKAVRDFAKKNLAAYKIPKEVEFVAELPKNNVGKVLRRELR